MLGESDKAAPWIQNGDRLEFLQNQQILIPCDKRIDFPLKRSRKDHVIIRITACCMG